MSEAISRETIHRAVKETIAEHMAGLQVYSISVENGFDYEDDPVFRIGIVYEGARTPTGREVASFVRHLREILSDANMNTDSMPFPMTTFTAKSDLSKTEIASLTPEAA